MVGKLINTVRICLSSPAGINCLFLMTYIYIYIFVPKDCNEEYKCLIYIFVVKDRI